MRDIPDSFGAQAGLSEDDSDEEGEGEEEEQEEVAGGGEVTPKKRKGLEIRGSGERRKIRREHGGAAMQNPMEALPAPSGQPGEAQQRPGQALPAQGTGQPRDVLATQPQP